MAQRNAQTHAKRARELAVREKRELKRAKKAARAAAAEDSSVVDAVTPSEEVPTAGSDAKEEEHGFQ